MGGLKQTNPFNLTRVFSPGVPLRVGMRVFRDGRKAGSGFTYKCRTLRRWWVEGCNGPPAVPTPSGGLLYYVAGFVRQLAAKDEFGDNSVSLPCYLWQVLLLLLGEFAQHIIGGIGLFGHF